MLRLANADIDGFRWPGDAEMCVTLTYDDGTQSHLDLVAPLLDRYGISASFYPVLDFVFYDKLDAWRKVASNGHEIGHHMITHAVRKYSQDGELLLHKGWVQDRLRLELYSVRKWKYELWLGNKILGLATNRKRRTFTFPANERYFNTADGIMFLDNDISTKFLGVRAFESSEPITSRHLCFGALPHVGGNANSTETVINKITKYQRKHLKPWFILNFHEFVDEPTGLSSSLAEHEKLIQFLVENKSRIAVMTVADAAMHLRVGKPEEVAENTELTMQRRFAGRVYRELLERYLRTLPTSESD